MGSVCFTKIFRFMHTLLSGRLSAYKGFEKILVKANGSSTNQEMGKVLGTLKEYANNACSVEIGSILCGSVVVEKL